MSQVICEKRGKMSMSHEGPHESIYGNFKDHAMDYEKKKKGYPEE